MQHLLQLKESDFLDGELLQLSDDDFLDAPSTPAISDGDRAAAEQPGVFEALKGAGYRAGVRVARIPADIRTAYGLSRARRADDADTLGGQFGVTREDMDRYMEESPRAREVFGRMRESAKRDREIGSRLMKEGLAESSEYQALAEASRAETGVDQPENFFPRSLPELGQAAKYWVSQAVESGPATAISLATGIATRSPVLGGLSMVGQVTVSELADRLNAGEPVDRATTGAVLYGLAEGIGEMVPLSIILKQGGPWLARVTKGAVSEGAQEMVTELLQIGIDYGVYDEGVTLSEALRSLGDAFVIGNLMGGPMAAVTPPPREGDAPAPPPAPDAAPPRTAGDIIEDRINAARAPAPVADEPSDAQPAPQPTMGEMVNRELGNLGYDIGGAPVEATPTFPGGPIYPGGIDYPGPGAPPAPPGAGGGPVSVDEFVAEAEQPGIDYTPTPIPPVPLDAEMLESPLPQQDGQPGGLAAPAPLEADLEPLGEEGFAEAGAAQPTVIPEPVEPGIPYGEWGAPEQLGVTTEVEGEVVSQTTPKATPRDRYYQERDDTKAGDILSAIAKKGGLDWDEAVGFGVDDAEKGRRGWKIAKVFKANGKGRSWDDMAQALAEEGWDVTDEGGNYDPNVLATRVHDALGGAKVTHPSQARDIGEAFDEFTATSDPYLLDEEYGDMDDDAGALTDATAWAGDQGLDEGTIEQILERGALQEKTDLAIGEELRDAAIEQNRQELEEGAGEVEGPQGRGDEAEAPEGPEQAPREDNRGPGLDLFGGRSETSQALYEIEQARVAKQRAAPDIDQGPGSLFAPSEEDKRADFLEAQGDLVEEAPSAPDAPEPTRPLSEIRLTQEVQDEDGNIFEVQTPAPEVIADSNRRLTTLNTLLDCLAA